MKRFFSHILSKTNLIDVIYQSHWISSLPADVAIRHCDSNIPGLSGDLIETEMSHFSPGGKHPTSNLSDKADLPSDIRLPCVNLNVQPIRI